MAMAMVAGVESTAAINTSSAEKYAQADDPAVEPEGHNEAALRLRIREIISRIQGHNFSLHRHGVRATHMKTQAVAKGTFIVSSCLLERLPKEFAASRMQRSPPDRDSLCQGAFFLAGPSCNWSSRVGMKILNVEGSFVDPAGERTITQDFTFNNAPILELRDLSTTGKIFTLREAHFRDPELIEPEVKKRKDAQLHMAPT